MQTTKTLSNIQEQKVQNSLEKFFDKFGIGKSLRHANINKIRGVNTEEVLLNIMKLPFVGKNFYQGVVKNDSLGYKKSVSYDFLNNCQYNWRKFLYEVARSVNKSFLQDLTSEDREKVLIIDDSSYSRNRSKKLELLARCYDHVTGTYYNGYRLLQLCWSDGNSTLPLDSVLLSTCKAKNRIQEIRTNIDKRTCGYKRRKEALTKATDRIFSLVKTALEMNFKAKYLLMDSWFGYPSIVSEMKKMIDVICMLKSKSKIRYMKDGNELTLNEIYTKTKKKRGKSNIKGSEIVEIRDGDDYMPVKIVFLKDRHKKKVFLAILSTDITLSDEVIVRIYGKRWNIEVYFKMIKQCLRLNKEIELRSYDGMIAHLTIVVLRYIFITVEQRSRSDNRSFGGVFLEMIDEMKDITLIEAISYIMEIVWYQLIDRYGLNEKCIENMINRTFNIVLQRYNLTKYTC
jgi:SRSO17 transposase